MATELCFYVVSCSWCSFAFGLVFLEGPCSLVGAPLLLLVFWFGFQLLIFGVPLVALCVFGCFSGFPNCFLRFSVEFPFWGLTINPMARPFFLRPRRMESER